MRVVSKTRQSTPYRVVRRNTGKPHGGGNQPPPLVKFLLNTLPVQQNAIYVWLDNEIWDDNLNWVGG